MTTYIKGTDNSAAAPAVTGTDGDTGLFFPAANTAAISTGGSEQLRIDSSGNLGLGVTPSAWASGKTAIEMPGGSSLSQSNGYTQLTNNAFLSASSWTYKANGQAALYNQYQGTHLWYTAPSGTAGNAITWTQAMTLDASGNLGIGTSSSVNGLSIYRYGTQWTGNTANTYPVPAGNVFLQMQTVASADNWFGMTGSYGASSGSANLLLQVNLNNTSQQAGNYIGSEAASATSANLTFGKMIGGATSGANSTKSEFMRIDSSGNLLVGTTNSNPIANSTTGTLLASGLINAARANHSLELSRLGTTGAIAYWYYNNSTIVGNISITASATAYNTSSDYRLKEDIQPMTGALAKVAALKPCTYKWKADGSDGEGFIAHELAEVCPQAVTGEKDAVDADGKPVYQGIDTSFLVATLTAAIQELKAELDSVKAELAVIKGA